MIIKKEKKKKKNQRMKMKKMEKNLKRVLCIKMRQMGKIII